MRLRAAPSALLLGLSSLLAAHPADAQEPPTTGDAAADRKAQAAALDRDARQVFADGDFARAAELFAQANATLPHPATRYNEAVARQRAGQLAQAANLLEAVVEELPETDARRKDANARLRGLSSQLGRLSLATAEAARASIGFVQHRPAPFSVFLEPGHYTLRVEFAAGPRDRPVDLRPGETLRLDVEAPRAAEPRPAVVADSGRSVRRTWGLVTLGAGAAAGAAAGALGYATLRAVDDFERSGDTDRALRDRAVRLRAFSNVALGVCVVASAVGIYLIVSKPDQPAATAVSLRLGLDGAELGAQF